jgi:hypothetical protein
MKPSKEDAQEEAPHEEVPHEEAPHEENDDKVLRTRRTPHEGLLVWVGATSATAQHSPALVKG